MKLSRKTRLILALVMPGAILWSMVWFFGLEAFWLFGYFTLVFTGAAFLLTWVFADWGMEAPRRPPSLRR
ncbi:MAG: hypothetical protein HY687_04355 [Chloroflexi bacterium]|nr:hypothetical protein [Chloroflexota bacterium]